MDVFFMYDLSCIKGLQDTVSPKQTTMVLMTVGKIEAVPQVFKYTTP
jgi:hypothetical protein